MLLTQRWGGVCSSEQFETRPHVCTRARVRFAFDLGHDAFDQIRGVGNAAQIVVQPEAVQRQCFFEAFFQTPCRRSIPCLEVGDEALQRALRIVVRAVRIRGLEFPPPLRVFRFREIAQDILSFVPRTVLHRHVVAEHITDGRAQSLRAIEHDELILRRGESALDELVHERGVRAFVFGRGLHMPQYPLFAVRRDAQGNDDFILGERLAIQ